MSVFVNNKNILKDKRMFLRKHLLPITLDLMTLKTPFESSFL